ncbi:MAG: hypothetical protein Q4F98_09235 [Lachnospiraceae bacterium]|nr:hypothetical protein [Lachnospiraceae bacterium]
MQKKKKKQLPAMLFVIPVIITAYSCRMLAMFDIGGEIFSLVRAMIYLALFDIWIVRVKRTVQQKTIQRYLLIAGGMMVFWIFVRTVKYEFELPPTAIRLCWYMYYLPMLTIPLMGLLTAITIGKLESKQFDRKVALLYIVTGILLLTVLTNDFHQLVFTFPEDVPFFQRLDKNYGYNVLYFAIFGWIGFCGLAALVTMWKKCKVPNTKKHLLKPLIPAGLSMGYSVIYLTGFSWLTFLFGDLPVTQSLLFVATYEACFSCGLIPTNTRYIDLFEVSSESSAQITDRDFNIRYKASDAQAVTKEHMALAINEPFPLDDGRVLHTMPIHGGYAVWTEDNSELIALQEELSLLKEEWQERNALLQSEYLLEEKRRKILEQNRLYDMLQAVTQKQIDKIALLMKEYQSKEKNSEESRRILAKIAVLCSFLKRRKHLALIADREYTVPSTELKLAFSESLRTLNLLGVESSLFIDTEKQLDGEDASKVYDFFEDVLEMCIDSLRTIDVRIVRRHDGLRIAVTAECDTDLSKLCTEYPEAEFDNYDGEQTCLLQIGTGGEE